MGNRLSDWQVLNLIYFFPFDIISFTYLSWFSVVFNFFQVFQNIWVPGDSDILFLNACDENSIEKKSTIKKATNFNWNKFFWIFFVKKVSTLHMDSQWVCQKF